MMLLHGLSSRRLVIALSIMHGLFLSPASQVVSAQGVCLEDTGSIPEETSPKTFVSWARRLWTRDSGVREIPSFRANQSFRPTKRGEIVDLIKQAEEEGDRIKWKGTLWAFEAVAVPGNMEFGPDLDTFTDGTVIESDGISGEIDRSLFLANLELTDPESREELRHIKGGTKIYNMNRLLHGLPAREELANRDDEKNLDCNDTSRAFPTLGGSGGQSVAGLIATGSHGGDIGLPPMADFTQAIHLIGPGGQEFWIERSVGMTAGSASDTQAALQAIVDGNPDAASEMCRDIIVKKDDDLFYATLVSVGRMGFVYSIVVKTEPAFKLREVRHDDTWEALRDSLTAPVFPSFVENRSLHYFQVFINPFTKADGNHAIKVFERTKIENCAIADSSSPSMAPSMAPTTDIGDNIFRWVCTRQNASEIAPLILGAVAGLSVVVATLFATLAGLNVTLGLVLPIPLVGPIIAGGIAAAIATTTVAIATATTASVALTALATYVAFGGLGRRPGELVGEISNVLFALDLPDLMREILSILFDRIYRTPFDHTDVGWKIMDTYPYENEDFCQKVESMDVAFDVSRATSVDSGYLAWITEVLSIFDGLYARKVAVAGVLTLRFTSNTESLIGMSKFPSTVHIEVPLLEDFAGNAEFLDQIQTAAIRHGGVPSWGQQMASYTKSDISDLHGEDLKTWQRSLALLIGEGGGNDFTFSNEFTTFYGLEPIAFEELRFTITVGNDPLGDTDLLRKDVSEDFVHITFTDDEVVTSPLNEGREWPAFSTNTRIVSLGPGKTFEDVESIRIEHQAAGGDINADNWEMNSIVVTSIAAEDGSEQVELTLSDNPLFQFQKNANQIWEQRFASSP